MNEAVPKQGHAGRRLWLFLLPIAVWGLHFLLAYVSAAIYCARSTTTDTLTVVRLVILGATVTALATLGVVAHRAYRRYRAGVRSEDHFVGSTVLMLCLLSAFAILAVASVALFFGDCRR